MLLCAWAYAVKSEISLDTGDSASDAVVKCSVFINDIKFKNFSNALKDSSVCIINCVSQSVAQDLNKMRVSFVDLLRESQSLLDFN